MEERKLVYYKLFKSLVIHKWYVLKMGLIIGKIPFWRLLIHDWSKFTPTEFFRYARYKFKDGTKEDLDWAIGWLHHLHHNPHHPEHWVTLWVGNPNFYDSLGKRITDYVSVFPMAEHFVREMVADMHATSKQVTGSWDISNWLNANGPKIFFHNETITLIDKVMKEMDYYLTDNCDWSWQLNIF